MPYRVRTVRDLDGFRAAIGSIGPYFGWQPTEEEGGRFGEVLPFDRMHAVFEDGRIVAGAGVFPFELTVPGGPIPCACVAVVGECEGLLCMWDGPSEVPEAHEVRPLEADRFDRLRGVAAEA